MKKILVRTLIAKSGLLLSLLAVLSISEAIAQSKPAVEKLPDWSGIWAPNNRNFLVGRGFPIPGGGGAPPAPAAGIPGPGGPGAPPAGAAAPGAGGPAGPGGPGAQAFFGKRPSQFSLTPAYQAIYDKLQKADTPPEDGRDCIPTGMPVMLTVPSYPLEIWVTPEKVVIMHEYMAQTRRIYTDGRKHPPAEELEDTYNGHSIGHWEGDTLVVDTVGLKRTNLYDDHSKHSDALRIVERIRRVSPDKLENQVTLTDEKALTKPFTSTFSWDRQTGPTWDLKEYVCLENNRN